MSFQFHNGTINTRKNISKRLMSKCFNSTTVQLILVSNALKHSERNVFQFHNGTINTVFAVTETTDKI